VFSGTAARLRDVQIIFSHGGGTMPFLTGAVRAAGSE